MMGAPLRSISCSTWSQWFQGELAKPRDKCCCPSSSTDTAKHPLVVKSWWLLAVRSRQNRMSGGLRDTEVNELTVTPTGLPAAFRVAATTMPVAKCPSVVRKALESMDMECRDRSPQSRCHHSY